MTFPYRRAAAIAALIALAPTAVLAQGISTPTPAPSDYSRCDGYGEPSKAGDGMTSQAWVMGIFIPMGPNGNTLRTSATLSAVGIAACDSALERAPEKFWQRKASLLRARAMHNLGINDPQAALVDLGRAEAAIQTPDDPYIKRGLLVGDGFIRAFAYRQTGDRAAAADLAVATWRSRPYNRQTALSALAAMGAKADAAKRREVLQGYAKVQPVVTTDLFWQAMEERRFSDAALLYPTLVPEAEIGDEPMLRQDRAKLNLKNRLRAESFWAAHAGSYAFALAATGRPDEARAALATARQRMEVAIVELGKPVLTKNGKPDGLDHIRTAGVAALQDEAGARLKEWDHEVERRIAVAEGDAVKQLEALYVDQIPNSPIFIDTVDALTARAEKDAAAALPVLKDLRRQLEKTPSEDASDDLTQLFKSLPDAETKKRIARYGKKANFFTGDVDAYDYKKNPDGTVEVRYYGFDASPSIVEELALLHAADLAHREGKRGLIVLGRRDYQHSTTNTMYGMPIATYHSGFESKLQLLFVDPAALPPGYEHAGWRVLLVEELYSALADIYGAPAQATKQSR